MKGKMEERVTDKQRERGRGRGEGVEGELGDGGGVEDGGEGEGAEEEDEEEQRERKAKWEINGAKDIGGEREKEEGMKLERETEQGRESGIDNVSERKMRIEKLREEKMERTLEGQGEKGKELGSEMEREKEKECENEGEKEETKREREKEREKERDIESERRRERNLEEKWERIVENRSKLGISKNFSDRSSQSFNNPGCLKCAQNFREPKPEKKIESKKEKITKKKFPNEKKKVSEEKDGKDEGGEDEDKEEEEEDEKSFQTKFVTCFGTRFRPQRVKKPKPVFDLEPVSGNGNVEISDSCKHSKLESILERMNTNAKSMLNEFENDLVKSMRNTLEKQELPERFSRAWKGQERKMTKTRKSSSSSSFPSAMNLEYPKSTMSKENGNLKFRKFVSDPVLQLSRGEEFDLNITEVEELLSSILRKNEYNKASRGKTMTENVSFPENVICQGNLELGYEKGKQKQKEEAIISLADSENCRKIGEIERTDKRCSEFSGANWTLTESNGIFQEENLNAVRKLREISRSMRGNRLKLAELGAIHVLISIIGSSSTGQNVLSAAITALLNLSIEVELKKNIVKEGVLQPLLQILKPAQEALAGKNGEKNGEISSVCNSVVEGGIGILCSLAAMGENRKVIQQLGFMELLVKFLGKDEMSARAHRDLTVGLVNLGLDGNGKEELVNLGCVDVLLEILKREKLDEKFTEDAIFFLSELVQLSQARIKFELSDGVELIGSVMEHGTILSKGFSIKILFLVASGSIEGIRMILEENLLLSVSLVADQVELKFRSMALSLVELLRKEETAGYFNN